MPTIEDVRSLVPEDPEDPEEPEDDPFIDRRIELMEEAVNKLKLTCEVRKTTYSRGGIF